MTINPTATLDQIEKSSESLPIIGLTLFWRLAGLRVNHQDLIALLDAAGFKEFAPDPPTPRKALHRALKAWIASKQEAAKAIGNDDDDHTQRTLVRVINKAKTDHLVFALVAEEVDLAKLGLSYATSIRILLEKRTGAMVCTTTAEGSIDAFTESQRVASELQPFWDEFKNLHIASDLSEMMRRIVESLQAISLRRSGGLYFIPATEKEKVDRLRLLTASFPHSDAGEPFICGLGVPDTRETKKQMAQALHAGIMDEVRSAAADLQRFVDSTGEVRQGTIEQRMLLYRQLKGKAGIYADLLEMNQDAIKAAVAQLESTARALLTKEVAPAAPSAPSVTSLFPEPSAPRAEA